MREGAALNTPDPATFYGGAEHGYLDYPALP
jgi:N-ethylmaleimide reductase